MMTERMVFGALDQDTVVSTIELIVITIKI